MFCKWNIFLKQVELKWNEKIVDKIKNEVFNINQAFKIQTDDSHVY